MDAVRNAVQTPVADLKSTVTKQIDARLKRLHSLESSLGADTSMSATERSTLEGELQHDIDGLTSLRSHVDGETSVDALKADQHSMVVDYRVFKVEAPKIELAEKLAQDRHRVDELEGKLQSQHGMSPSDVAATRHALDAANAALAGQDKALLALKPQDYAAGMFDRYRDALQLATTKLDAAAHFLDHA